jgi:hypothetical protein
MDDNDRLDLGPESRSDIRRNSGERFTSCHCIVCVGANQKDGLV